MLGLDPLPERTDLKPVVTGTRRARRVRRREAALPVAAGPVRHRQPVPAEEGRQAAAGDPLRLRPRPRDEGRRAAAAARRSYQHHGAWFARNGYVCLTIDTLQLGEIEGIHHGTHRYGMWWWLKRGYTPAGVEAWNCVRALDYLETRPEVDKTRFGVTGRCGGGAYSWWIAAIDERIKVRRAGRRHHRPAEPRRRWLRRRALRLHVHGQHLPLGLSAGRRPRRPAAAADRQHRQRRHLPARRRRIARSSRSAASTGCTTPTKKGTSAKVALNITAGPHKDTQELQTHAFRWFNHYLKGDDSPIDMPRPKYLRARAAQGLRQAAGGPDQHEDSRDVRRRSAAAAKCRPTRPTLAGDARRVAESARRESRSAAGRQIDRAARTCKTGLFRRARRRSLRRLRLHEPGAVRAAAVCAASRGLEQAGAERAQRPRRSGLAGISGQRPARLSRRN